MGFWDRGIPDKYKKYVTNNKLRTAFHKALKSGDMSGWEASINYQPPAVTPVAPGVDANPKAVAKTPGGGVGANESSFNMAETPTPESLNPPPESLGDSPTSLLDRAQSTNGDTSTFNMEETPTQESLPAENTDVVSEITGGKGGIVNDIKEANKVNTEIDEKNVPFRFDKNPTKESLPAGPEPEGGNVVLETVDKLKKDGQATGPGVSQLQEYAKTMTGIEGRTKGTINAAGSATIAALSGLGKNIDEVQAGFSKFRENIKGRVASGVSALKGEVGWGSHSSEYDQFKSDLKASGLDEDWVRRGKAHSEGQDAEDAGGVEVGQEDKKKLESDAAHQKYKSDMIAAGGAIGANAFKGGGGKAVSFNRMGQY